MAIPLTDIRSVARLHTSRAIRVLVGIMTSAKAAPAARVAAANAVLDRGWGKPKQMVEQTSRNYVMELPSPAESVEEWERQNRTR